MLQKNLRLFNRNEFGRLFPVSRDKLKYFLEEQTKKNLFSRLKNGLYMLKTDPADETEIANKLYQPSYLSFEYVLAAGGILPEMPYAVTSATTKPTRIFTYNGKAYIYQCLKQAAFTGYRPVKQGGGVVFIANPEKALADYLYFVVLGKKSFNDRLDLAKINRGKLLVYCRLFNRKKLMRLAETL